MEFGYTRVSTTSQNDSRQLDGIQLDKTFADKISGKTKERPALKQLLEQIREGDTIHVHSIDRIARNLYHLQELISEITGMGATIHFHKENLIFDGSDNPMQKMQMQMMGAVAEFERNLINERAAEGRAAAKAKGVQFGRKPKLEAEDYSKMQQERADGKTAKAIAIDFDISLKTVYRALAAVV